MRCFRCNQKYPLGLAVRNAVLERRIAQRFVEERRSIVVTCKVCRHPAPFLLVCRHCEARICSQCRNSHTAKVMPLTSSSYFSFSSFSFRLVLLPNSTSFLITDRIPVLYAIGIDKRFCLVCMLLISQSSIDEKAFKHQITHSCGKLMPSVIISEECRLKLHADALF